MKEIVDKCSAKGCAVNIGAVIDNDNCVTPYPVFSTIMKLQKRICQRYANLHP